MVGRDPSLADDAESESLKLRDYQTECIQAVTDDFRDLAVTRQLVALPTGTGKTVIFSRLPAALGARRTLVLAHREELIDQAAEKMRTANPDRSIGIEMAERRASPQDDIVVASVQSLHARLKQYRPGEFDLVVCDEAHHAPARTYMQTFHALGLLDGDPGRLLVGFTATTGRGDGVGLGKVFEKVVFSRSLREMIDAGWLVDIAGFRVATNASLAGVRSMAGDFAPRQLAAAVNTLERNRLIVQTYQDMAVGRRALAFTVDVQHAKDLAATFQQAGIAAAAVSGDLPKAERRGIIEAYRAGEASVLCNCNLLTEGFDDPETAAVLMARPTRSRTLYTQMLGRGTRLAPGKQDLILIDFADTTRHCDIATLPSLFGLNVALDMRGRGAADLAARVESAGIAAGQQTDIRRLEAAIEKVDLFRVPSLPPNVETLTRNAWIPVLDGVYRLPLPDRRAVVLTENALGGFECWMECNRRRQHVATLGDLADAFDHADGCVPREARNIVLRGARWRGAPPSPKQLGVAAKLGLPVNDETTKGALSAMISAHFARRGGAAVAA